MNLRSIATKASEIERKGGPQKRQKPLCAHSQLADSPVERVLFLQRTVGNRAVQGLLKNVGSQQSAVRAVRHSWGVQSTVGGRRPAAGNRMQAKLTIGQPNDIYEQEADRVADEVMRMSDRALS